MEKIKSFLTENKSTKQIFFKNSFWLFSGNVISRILRAALVIASARILKTEGYGIYSYALSLAGFFTIFSDIGISSLLTREVAKKQGDNYEKTYISNTFYIKIILIITSSLLLIFVGPFFTKIEGVTTILPLIAILTASDSLRGFFYSIARALNKMEIEAKSLIATEIFIDTIVFAILILNPTIFSVTSGYTAGAFLGCVLSAWQTRKFWSSAIKIKPSRDILKTIISESWPFAIVGVFGSFMINIDSIIIGMFRSAHELGIYGAANKPVQLMYIIPSLFSASIFPLISSLIHKNEMERAKTIINNLIKGLMMIAFPITIGGILTAPMLIELMFGKLYLEGIFTFQLLLLTIIPIFIGTAFGNSIFALNRQNIFIKTTAAGAFTNTILDLILIPTYGLPGSAVATIISQIVANGYVGLKLNEIIKINPFKGISKIIISTLFMTIALFFMLYLKLNFFFIVFLGIIIYFGTLILLKEDSLKAIPLLNKLIK